MYYNEVIFRLTRISCPIAPMALAARNDLVLLCKTNNHNDMMYISGLKYMDAFQALTHKSYPIRFIYNALL